MKKSYEVSLKNEINVKNTILKIFGRFAGFAGLLLIALIISPLVSRSVNAQNKAAKAGAGKKAAASKKAGKKGKTNKKSKNKDDDDDEQKVVILPPRTGQFKAGDPISKTAKSFGTTPALRNMPAVMKPDYDFDGVPVIEDEENNEVEVIRTIEGARSEKKLFFDPLSFLSRRPSSLAIPQAMPGPLLSFNGILSADVISTFGTGTMPPDTVGDVGPNHYVQATNFGVFRIFDKSGNPLTATARISSIFSGLPANDECRTADDGDPVVNYDPMADRWLVSQFYVNRPGFGQCIAVSQTGDPTGAWYAYNFPSPAGNFPDYPHWAVWSDGYYLSTHEFNAAGTAYVTGGFYAFNRNKMLVGDPTAEFIYFTDNSSYGHLPADVDGYLPPPTGTSELFMEFDAVLFGGTDRIVIHELVPDFTTPANSTFTLSDLPISAYDPRDPSGRNDVEQPVVPATSYLDSIGGRALFRVAYRNLGTSAAPVNSYVTNLTVNVSGVAPTTAALYQAAIRWEELRRSSAGAMSVFDEGTHAPDPVDPLAGRNRWMGSIAQDYLGNIGLGFSRSGRGATDFPDIVWAGRTGGQTAAGVLNEGEATMHASTGYQNISNGRWGDYSAMTVDPTDDCTFWFTTEWRDAAYNATTNSDPFRWSTRIGNFKFPGCTVAPKGQIAVNVTNCDTGQPIDGAAVIAQAGGFLRTTNASGNLITNIIAAPGTYTVSGFRNGFTGSSTANVTVTDGNTTTVNICLSGAFTDAELVSTPAAIPVDENTNGRFDPGETATLDIPVRNTGGLDASNVSATLTTTTPGVTILSPQTLPYPDIPANGETRSSATPFKFRLNSDFVCGSSIDFTLSLNYNGTTSAETFNFTIATLPPVSISTTLDTTAPPTNPDYTATTGTQTGRLNRFAPPSSCGMVKTPPTLFQTTGARRYDAYTFTASTTGCITVTLSSTNGTSLYSATYNGAGFVPANPSTNYLADAGSSSVLSTYSFNVTAGQAFTVVVHEVNPGGAPLVNYTLSLDGPVARTCQPYLAPTASSAAVSGRVTSPDGRGINRAVVKITDQNGESRYATTNSFGHYSFEEVEVGETYVFTIQSKQYKFAPRVMQILENIDNLNFTAGGGR